jgi:hypothetical protein
MTFCCTEVNKFVAEVVGDPCIGEEEPLVDNGTGGITGFFLDEVEKESEVVIDTEWFC